MPTQLQLRRGTNSEMSSFTGAVGELTVNTTNKSLHLHDGSTAGGIEFVRVDLSNSTGSWTLSDGTNTSAIVIGNDTLTVNGTTNQIDVLVGTDSVTLSTPDSGVTAASYGSSTAIPVVTVDAKGRVTGVTTASITAGAADTDELDEGSSNLYFTNARADARITNALKDEDNMASDSATHVPSQQSVKAYVDAQILTKDNSDEIAEGSSNLYYTDARVSTRTDTILNHSNHTNVTVAKVGSELRLSAASSYGDSNVSSYLSSNGFATQTAIVAAITDSAPSTLDTLNELAAALGDDANFSATTATALGLRVSKTADTGAAIMPAGTTAQRPTGAAGHVRYNSDLEQIEAYTDAWVPLGGASTVNADTFTANGSTTAYALSQTVSSEDNLLVFIEGVFQQQDAYSIATASGTTTLTFSAAPSNTNTILVYSFASNIQGSNLNIDTMTGDGSDVTLSLSIAPVNENNTQVFIDGVYQNKSGYSISGSTLTFSTAPPNGSAVEVMTMTQTEVNVPVDGTITSAKLSGDLTTPAALTVTGEITANGGISLIDNKKLTFGTGDDLQVYHDGNNSYINDVGTGNIFLRGANVVLATAGGTKYLEGGSNVLRLYHTGNQRMQTSAAGISVTGTVTATGTSIFDALDISGNVHIQTASAGTVAASSQADDLVIENSAEGGMTIITPDDQSARIRFTSPSTNNDVGGATIFYRQNINKMNTGTGVAGGVLSLQSGAANETIKLASDSNVEMRGSSNVRISLGTAGTSGANNTSNWIRGNSGYLQFNSASSGYNWEIAGANKMMMDSSGNVAIGQASASASLLVQGADQTDGTVRLQAHANKGSRDSHIHYGTNGDWYIRSADTDGKVIINDGGGNLGIGDTTATTTVDLTGAMLMRSNITNIGLGTYTVGNGMTTATGGELEFIHQWTGTMSANDTIAFTYNALAWKSWWFEIILSSTGSNGEIFRAGGYNNNSDGNSVTQGGGASLAVSRSGQANTFTLTLSNTQIHPLMKIRYGCGGGEGPPQIHRAQLVITS